MTAMQNLMQRAREYASVYDPEHAQIRPEFLMAALPEMCEGVCVALAEFIAEEVPEFWMRYREFLAGYYQVGLADVSRKMQADNFGDLSGIQPDNITANIIALADSNWKRHAKIVKAPTPVDYLLGEVLALEGHLDILDLTLSNSGIERSEIMPYLAGCSRHINNDYLKANVGMQSFTSLEDACDWINTNLQPTKRKTEKTKTAKATPSANNLAAADRQIRERVIGQSKAIDAVMRALKIAEAGLKDPVKPIGVLLFAGPTGVGKTELSKATAEATGRKIQRYDMSEYQEPHSVMRLFGAPPSYVGYDEGGQLTKFVSDNPKSVIVFDEAEKAHPDVLNALLQIAEEGTLTDGKGKVVSFAETLVLITTNIGASEAAKTSIGFSGGNDDRAHAFKAALEKFFKPELRGRLTATIIFERLTAEEILQVAGLELTKLAKRLHDTRGMTLEFEPQIGAFIAQQSDTLQYGARNIKMTINNLISGPLSDFIVGRNLPDKTKITVGLDDKAITFNTPLKRKKS